jgi:hypothetical protein
MAAPQLMLFKGHALTNAEPREQSFDGVRRKDRLPHARVRGDGNRPELERWMESHNDAGVRVVIFRSA